MQYEVLGKFMRNYKMSALRIKGDDGSITKVSIDEFKDLVSLGKIKDFTLEEYNGKEYLHSVQYNISKLPVLEDERTMEVVDRIVKDGNITGYKVRNTTGNDLRISKNKAWELARDGLLSNMEIGYTDIDGKKERKLIMVN